MHKGRSISYVVASCFVLILYVIAYLVERHETGILLVLYAVAFALYFWTIEKARDEELKFWIAGAIVFRFVLLFSIPNLSEDFYRFIWDGRLLAGGYHPFAHPPSWYIEHNISIAGIDHSIYANLNSKNYFTVYPPVAQALFWISTKLPVSLTGSVIILKSFNFLSEAGSIFILQKLLRHFHIEPRNVLTYAINPLVILELMGNAHLEAVMIFCLLLTCHFLIKQQLIPSSIAFSMAICVKLIPLIFLPAFSYLLGWRKAFTFYCLTFLSCVIFFIPFISSDLLTGYQTSLAYYFARFEFNASIYYLVRAAGQLIFGYNPIHIAGPLLGLTAGVLIIIIALRGLPATFSEVSERAMDNPIRKRQLQFLQILAGCLLVYFLFTTTLHPWYISTLLALTVFTNFRFTALWTFMIFLTYAGYGRGGFEENLWIVSVEYIAVFGYFAYELWRKKSVAVASLSPR